MNLLPIFIRLEGRRCVVVGGGEIAVRKIRLLRKAGAAVTVISPHLCASLAADLEAGRLDWIQARFDPAHLEDAALAIAATDEPETNRQVSIAAQARNIPVNVVDAPALCSFVMPSIIDRSPLVVAVSSGGAAPVLSRLLRARLETLIPATYGRLAKLAGDFREQVKRRLPDARQRRIFWENVLEGPIAEQMLAGREDAAYRALQHALDQSADSQNPGEVYLVGAGPGDPDLLTFRALRLMQKADVVLYDALVSQGVLELVRRDAERIYVGKRRASHTLLQEEINHLLVRLAQEGKRVLRLKGGDPFIFGRGGEEIDTLAEHGIPFQIVPGISAANGVASYAGIPLTHRDYAQSVLFVTGHLRDGSVDLDWHALTRPRQTVVIYMGLTGLDIICRKLIEHGLPPDWPAAVVQQGTTPHQRVITSTLSELAKKVEAAGLKAPTLTLIGEVVKLREKLAWFG
ncbi:MAG: siroheme synthase CysG [Methylophilaceae bacterium]|nr:siroheme synthase CysG [Methylophilaceae bacterium]